MAEKKEEKPKKGKKEDAVAEEKKGYREEIQVPGGIEVKLEGNVMKVRGAKGETEKTFSAAEVNIKTEKGKIVLETPGMKRKQKSSIKTLASIVKNLLKGVQEGYKYELEIVYSHFPMNVSTKKDTIQINNFLGRKNPTHSKIIGQTKAEVKGNNVILSGVNKEHVGQTAANLEKATRVTGKDRRVYQDGIYITGKNV